MAGHRNYKQLRDKIAERVGEDQLAERERAVIEAYDAETLRLADVRKARRLTQVQLAKALSVSQAQVSRIEGQADLYLSTLATYIEAMGGRLDLVAVFEDEDAHVHLNIGELAEDVAAAVAAGERSRCGYSTRGRLDWTEEEIREAAREVGVDLPEGPLEGGLTKLFTGSPVGRRLVKKRGA